MNCTKAMLLLLSILAFGSGALYSQSFHQDGRMKLTAVATNKNYGYEANHKTAIKVGTVRNQYAFLRSLRGPNGEAIQYRRLGSCCSFKNKKAAMGHGFLDKWELTYEGLEEPIILYLNGYDYENPKCPYGLSIGAGDESMPLPDPPSALQL